MHLLFLLPDFPYPASTGGRLKVFNILKYMSREHRCDILCFGETDLLNIDNFLEQLPTVRVLDVLPPVSGTTKRLGVLWHLIRLLPPSLASFSDSKYASAVSRALTAADYDLIHFDIVNMAQHLPPGVRLSTLHSPNDATSLIYSRMADKTAWSLAKIKLLISVRLLQRYERQIYPLFDMVHVVSRDDALYLQSLAATINVSVVPIAVDEAFLGEPNLVDAKQEMPDTGSPTIICNGNLGNPAIADGVREFLNGALPLILKQWPAAKLLVLGQNIDESLRTQLLEAPNTEFLTWVDDYRAFLAKADVVLVPDHVGAPGAKTRTLQAMGLGLPVVGTHTAFAGIPFVNHEHGLSYKTMPECAERICALLGDKKMRKILAANARQLVADEFSLSVVGPKYEQMYFDAVANFDARGPIHVRSAVA